MDSNTGCVLLSILKRTRSSIFGCLIRISPVNEIFLSELREKHDVETAVFPVDNAKWLQIILDRHGLDCRYELYGNRNAVERLFREVK